MILNFIRGFCMALADSVPGVSGGTIAFLLGFYDDFIGSLNALLGRDNDARKKGIIFLLKIGIGWVVGFCMAALFITSVFESHIYQISSLFIGFILFAIPIIAIEEKEVLVGKYINVFWAIIGGAIVVSITYFSGATIFSEGVNLAVGKFSPGVGVMLFIAGMVAISAMVLPGISGSTILMIFGLYVPVITAIKDILHFKLEYVPAVAIFGIGVVVGALLIVKLIKYVLEHFRSQTVYFIIGMMIASIYSITQGAKTLDNPKPALSFSTFSIVFFVIGGAIIFGLQFMKSITESKENKEK